MKPESSPSVTPITPSPTGDAAAAAYIAQELPKARKALRRARIIGLVLIGFIGGYFTVISVTLVRFFQPQAAAQVHRLAHVRLGSAALWTQHKYRRGGRKRREELLVVTGVELDTG